MSTVYYGQPATIANAPTPPLSVNIASSTNAMPIVVTTSTPHGLQTGMAVLIRDHLVNTNANGLWIVHVLTSTTFRLLTFSGSNSVGNGVGAATGTSNGLYLPGVTLPEDAVDDCDASSVNVPLEALADMTAWVAHRLMANPFLGGYAGSVRTRVQPFKEGNGTKTLTTGATYTDALLVPHGAKLMSVSVWITPGTHVAWPPGTRASVDVVGFDITVPGSAGSGTGEDAAANLTASNQHRAVTAVGSGPGVPILTMDRTKMNVIYTYTHEDGANEQDCTVWGTSITYIPAGIDDAY